MVFHNLRALCHLPSHCSIGNRAPPSVSTSALPSCFLNIEGLPPCYTTQQVGLGATTRPLSEVYFDRKIRTERIVDRSLWTTKPLIVISKTKGLLAPSTLATEPNFPSEQPELHPIFKVGFRVLKVFLTLFYTHSFTLTPGECLGWTFSTQCNLLVLCLASSLAA